MQTIAQHIYPEHFQHVKIIVNAIQNNDLDLANRLLAERLDRLAGMTEGPERLQVELFLEALRTRLDEASQVSNLYLTSDQGRQIRMFNFMAEKFPVVRRTQDIANALLANAIGNEKRFILLDIGMGTGQQAANLLEHHVPVSVQEVMLLGIEPSAENLETARKRFQQLSQEKNLPIRFIELHKTAEQLDAQDWDAIRQHIADFRGPLLLNASFALHHVQPVSIRTDFFRCLKGLHPALFVIIEPYGDYTTENMLERFHNAWHHYGLTFRAIDAIDASDTEKSEVKRVFFGRELPDVLAKANRIEQYETGEMWLERLEEAGFQSQSIQPPPFQEFNTLIQVTSEPGYLGFNVSGYPIVAVLAAH